MSYLHSSGRGGGQKSESESKRTGAGPSHATPRNTDRGSNSAAALALKKAREVGLRVGSEGDTLTLEAAAAPPQDVLDLLVRHKADILALLRPAEDGWMAEDWQVFFDERAAVAEFDSGLPRAEAEARAFDCCAVEWLNRNPVRSPPSRCLNCGQAEHSHDPLLPFGTGSSGYAWLHSRCWPAWHEARKAEAIAALTAMGILEPRTSR
jgi:hypothetical protein